MLDAEKIKSNWEEYRNRVNTLFPTRKDALNKMYDMFEERMVFMPASSMEHRALPTGAFPAFPPFPWN